MQVLHAHGIFLHGHLHYKWMVAILEILRTKARLKKKGQMDFCQFQSNVANALLLGSKEKDTPKPGRPSSSSIPNGLSTAKKRYSAAFPIPVEDIRFDRVGHFPVFTKKQNRCRFCPRGYSHIKCANAISNFVWSRREIAFMHLYQISTMNSQIDHGCVLTLWLKISEQEKLFCFCCFWVESAR